MERTGDRAWCRMAISIRTSLQQIRNARGFSAAELARQAGVSRQTIYSIEDGSFVPNTAVALRLARILDVKVEQLFDLQEESPLETSEAEFLAVEPKTANAGDFVRLCRVNGRLLATPLSPFPPYLPVADGVVTRKLGSAVAVEHAVDLSQMENRLLLAGCDPALSLLAGMLRPSGIEVVTVPGSSRRALKWLTQQRVHAAGSHLADAVSGEYNVPLIKRLFPANDVRTVTFASWEQGFVLQRGNPKGIRSVADLAEQHTTFINREKGSGSRAVLDKELRKAGIPGTAIAGYEIVASGHLAAAYTVAMGAVDCCVATRSAARLFNLDFIPLSLERFDLTFSKAWLELPAANALLDVLNRSSLRRKLEALAGYDTTHTGDVLL